MQIEQAAMFLVSGEVGSLETCESNFGNIVAKCGTKFNRLIREDGY